MLTTREANLMNAMLEVIDFSDDGIPTNKIEEVMMQAVSFAVFVKTLNVLISHGLVTIDSEHIARRVRT